VEIDGKKRREIREALTEAFPMPAQLRLLTDEVLDEPLQNITSLENNMPTMVFEVITWAQARGRLTELVLGAAAGNPGAARLKVLAEQFRFPADVPGEIERMVLKDVPFENIGQWLDRFTRLRRAVCRIEPQPGPDLSGYGTGFLIAPEVVMTNFHVVEPFLTRGAERVVVRFDYETGTDGVSVSQGRECRLAADWRLLDSPVAELDCALVRLAEPAGSDVVAGAPRGVLRPVRHMFRSGAPLMILQHPTAAPLKLSIGSVVDPGAAPNRVSYTANTEPGSSGSPCFTSGLDLVALHHMGGDPNRGVRLGAILDFLGTRKTAVEAMGLGGIIG
jgi:hypothetical protein